MFCHTITHITVHPFLSHPFKYTYLYAVYSLFKLTDSKNYGKLGISKQHGGNTMEDLARIVFILILILVGLNLTANNSLVSILVGYVFYGDRFSGIVLRFSGLTMALSSLLVIFNYTQYCLYINILLFLILTFFSIRGRNKAYAVKASARDKLLKQYEEEIRRKRERIEELKHEQTEPKPKPAPAPTGEAEKNLVSERKKKMWDDGTMTNKELINAFKEDNN